MKFRSFKYKKILPAVLFLVFVLLGISGYRAFAGEDGLTIKTIKPVPGFSSRETGLERAIERRFQVIGTLDFIGDGYIVVDDSQIKTAPRINIPDSMKGKFVGVRLNDRNEAFNIQTISKPE